MNRFRSVFLIVIAVAAILILLIAGTRLERVTSEGLTRGDIGALKIEPAPGTYDRGVRVRLWPFEPRGRVSVTLDGTYPARQGDMAYESPVWLDGAAPGVTVLRAVEYVGEDVGPELIASYAVGLQSTLPVISLVAEPSDLWDQQLGILANPSWRGRDWERSVHIAGLLPDQTFAVNAGLRVDKQASGDSGKVPLRIYFRRSYGTPRLEFPLYPEHPTQSAEVQGYKRLLLQAGDHGVTWTLLRDQIVEDISQELELPAAEGRFVWLFVNGTSWGLYRLTERVDRFMVADNFGVQDADVLFEGQVRDGTDADWDALIDWVETNDLREEQNMTRFLGRVDIENLTDYLVLYSYFRFPAHSLAASRSTSGRWFWIFQGGSEVELEQADLDVLFNAMLRNEGYRRTLRTRASEILGTKLAPAALDVRIEELSTKLGDAFPHEQSRWAGVPSWSDELHALRVAFDESATELIDQFGLTGRLQVRLPMAEHGSLYVNGLPVPTEQEIWSGAFAPAAVVDLVAVPSPDYVLSGWSVMGSDVMTLGASAHVTITDTTIVTPTFASRPTDMSTLSPSEVMINEIWIDDNRSIYPSLGGRAIEGDWVELLVQAPDGADIRGWRLTDNDTRTSVQEGSLIFGDHEQLAAVPCGTVILIVATQSIANDLVFPVDDLSAANGRLILYVGNDTLDALRDPGFDIGINNDSVALLAPGPSAAFGDDIGRDFVAEGRATTPATFGILGDGIVFDAPFHHLGQDDGAFLQVWQGKNAVSDWHVNPSSCESRDAHCLDAVTLVTPGELNPGQQLYRAGCLWVRSINYLRQTFGR